MNSRWALTGIDSLQGNRKVTFTRTEKDVVTFCRGRKVGGLKLIVVPQSLPVHWCTLLLVLLGDMFGLGRDLNDSDLPQVTLWRDFEEPVQLPTAEKDDLHFSLVMSNPPSPVPERNADNHENSASREEHGFEVVHVNRGPERACFETDLLRRPETHRITWLHVFSFLPGFHPVVKILLAHGADPNSVATWYHLTPLHIAATPETTRLLLEYEAEVNVKDRKLGCTPLLQATVNGRHSVVEVLLAHGADPNIANKDETSPLHHAKSAETAELLIAKGAEVDAKNEDNETPLFIATMENRPSVVEVLIAHGADPNINNKSKSTPLHQARSAGTAELLIQKGAEVNTKNTLGETPLYFATRNNRHSVVEVLLAHGADPNIANHNKESPLHHAQATETAKLLLEYKAKVDQRSLDKRTPLFQAIFNGAHSVVEVLLAHEADPNIIDSLGRSSLHWTASAETAELLIMKGAAVNPKDKFGETPLFVATQNDHHSIIEVLLAHGADPNITDSSETSPLHIVKSAEIAQLLIEKNADVNARDRNNETPLFIAAIKNRHPVIEALLAGGADPNIANIYKGYPLHMAKSAETAHLLIEKGADVNAKAEVGKTPLFIATDRDRHSVVEVLLAHGADPNIANKYQRTPLHEAKSAETAELLMQKGADVNAKDDDGGTPLFVASQRDRPSVSEVLLAHGADPNITDKTGRSPLSVATHEGHHSVAEVLLIHGADPNIIDYVWERSPLHHAQSAEITELLIEKKAEVNAKDKLGFSPLFIATGTGLHSVVKALLAHGADPNIANHYGTAPLHQARSAETVKLLVEKGANVDCIDVEGDTALHSCCERCREDAVKQLLIMGASSDIRNTKGHTACEVAIHLGFHHIAILFPNYLSLVLSSKESRFKQEFDIEGNLGKGTYGKVYKVKKRGTEELYAIKEVRKTGNLEEIGKTLREVRAVMELRRSPRIVECYQAWIEPRDDNEQEDDASSVGDKSTESGTSSSGGVIFQDTSREANQRVSV
ncbi:unnamed protein product [Cyprideis torosa]|uniref:Uncharacterized protein n=1 Tax=Cyprideis torosa TaxID=163714 RepID=A0A7R8ZMZ3_9CRUS|nr:unnamed protein product [Cyprideis torosa]CAG0895051.1 unnamed protein product [Cyprideis torosa]